MLKKIAIEKGGNKETQPPPLIVAFSSLYFCNNNKQVQFSFPSASSIQTNKPVELRSFVMQRYSAVCLSAGQISSVGAVPCIVQCKLPPVEVERGVGERLHVALLHEPC